jgi:hypothetical protein
MALIQGKQLASQAIDTRELKDSGVTVAKIADTQITAAKLNISAQAWDFSAASAFSVPAPSTSAHAATKGYVDGVAQGLDVKASVRLATVLGDLSSFTYSGGVLTQQVLLAEITIDGVAPALNNRVLVRHLSTASENGIYTISQVGDGSSTAWTLTRAADFNTSALASPGSFTFVEEGNTLADTGWVMSANAPITLDTSDITFTQFSSAGVVNAGDGLGKSGNDLFVKVLSTGGLEISSDELKIKIKNSSVATDASGLEVGLNAEGSIAIKGAAGLAAPIMRPQAGLAVASAISTDDTDTGLSLSATPTAGGFVQVLINGVMIELGDGVKTKDGYFSGDDGSTARAHSALASGDKFFWNGSSVFTLDTTDRVDFLYSKI